MKKVVTDYNLGKDIIYNAGEAKLEVSIDEATLVRNGDGKIEVDVSDLQDKIKIVSDDAGNVLSIGNDKGAFVNAATIKSLVGEMVASATDGIDYDALSQTLKAYLASLAVTDSDSIDLTITEDTDGDGTSGDVSIKADLKVDPDANNLIEVGANGVLVDKTKVDNLYNVDGALQSNRTVDLNGKTMKFSGGSWATVTIEGNDTNGGYLEVKSNTSSGGFYQQGDDTSLWNEKNQKDWLYYRADNNTAQFGGSNGGINVQLYAQLKDYNGSAGAENQVLVPVVSGGAVVGVKWVDLSEALAGASTELARNNDKLEYKVNGTVVSSVDLEEVQDLAGNTLFYGIQ